MGMTQIVIGAALGCIAAQGGLYSFRRLVGWLQRDDVGARIRALTPTPGHAVIGAFIKYAAPVGASAALITLGVWSVGDYIAARSARSVNLASTADTTPALPAPQRAEPEPNEVVRVAAGPKADPPAAPADDKPNPYADPEYQVHRHPRHAGTALSLKETLLKRSEDKARAELVHEMQQRAAKSQYDCEAAEHAGRYLKADLDVWGFASWQAKYFPMESYKGATLPQCRDIKNVVDPGALDLQSTVAQQNRH